MKTHPNSSNAKRALKNVFTFSFIYPYDIKININNNEICLCNKTNLHRKYKFKSNQTIHKTWLGRVCQVVIESANNIHRFTANMTIWCFRKIVGNFLDCQKYL